MIDALNAIRAENELAALRQNMQLAKAAQAHAADVAAHPGLVHIGSDGSMIDERMRRQGYYPAAWREIVGWGWDGNTAKMVEWWMGSGPHRDAILSDAVTEAGWAYVYRPGSRWGHYWVVLLGRGQGVVTPPPAPPGDYVVHVPVVAGGREIPPSGAVDLLAYLRGDGRAYRVGNAWGSFEVFQTQTEGDRFYQVKAWDDLSRVNWEEYIVEGENIGRDVDTSPGGDRFYRQFGAPWVRRWMRPGETFRQAKRLQFYNHRCEEIDPHLSGHVVDSIRFVAHYPRYTFPARDWAAVTLEDVVELEWLEGGEVYHFARGFGLVGWSRRHQDPHSPVWTAVSEMRPGVGRLERLRVRCL